MTFVVLTVGSEQEKVVGTIWAAGEAQAQMIASNLCCLGGSGENQQVVVRKTENREIPLILAN